jgi:hypothetical protein
MSTDGNKGNGSSNSGSTRPIRENGGYQPQTTQKIPSPPSKGTNGGK